MHFALYETKTGAVTTGAQLAFRIADLASAHQQAIDAGIEVIHEPQPQPRGFPLAIETATATSSS